MFLKKFNSVFKKITKRIDKMLDNAEEIIRLDIENKMKENKGEQ